MTLARELERDRSWMNTACDDPDAPIYDDDEKLVESWVDQQHHKIAVVVDGSIALLDRDQALCFREQLTRRIMDTLP